MEIIKQLGLIIGFGYAGELLAQILPFRLPAGVLGIVLVFTVLSLGVLRPRHFGKTADFISAHMAFFFLPLAVSVLQNYQTISPVLFQVLAVCLISTLITFTVSYAAVRLLRSIAGKGGSPASLARLPPASTKTPDSAEAEFALHANSVSKKPVRGFCSGTPLCGGTAGPAAAPATPPDSAVDLTHKTTCSIRAGKNPEKTLVESASAIFDTSYLRYAPAGNSKGFSGLFPGSADTLGWVKSNLCCEEEIC